MVNSRTFLNISKNKKQWGLYHHELLNCLYHMYPLHCMWIKRFFFHFYWSQLQKKNSYWTLSCPNVYLEWGCRWISSLAAGAECALVVGTHQHLMPKTFTQTHTNTEQVMMAKTISRHTICQASWQLSPSCIKINRIIHLCTELQAPCHFRHLEMRLWALRDKDSKYEHIYMNLGKLKVYKG